MLQMRKLRIKVTCSQIERLASKQTLTRLYCSEHESSCQDKPPCSKMPFWKGCQQWVDCDYKPALKYLWLYFLLNKHSCPYHLHRTDNWGGNEKTTGLNAIGRHDVLVQTQEEVWFSIKEPAAYDWDESKAFGLLLRISPRCSRGLHVSDPQLRHTKASREALLK